LAEGLLGGATQSFDPTIALVSDPTTSSQGDNQAVQVLAGRSSELFVSELHGRFYSWAQRGRTFAARTAHGGAVVPIYTATAQTFAVINPMDSGVNLELLTFRGDISATGTAVISELYLEGVSGSAFNTLMAGTVTPLANGVQNLLIGRGFAPKSFAATAVTSASQADTYICGLGAFTTTTTTNGNLIRQFDGAPVVPPGTCIFVTSLAAQTSIMHLEFIYNEVPV